MPSSTCVKKTKSNCRNNKSCMYANGSKRKFCRKSGKTTCRGKPSQICNTLKKCMYINGQKLKYCKRKNTLKKNSLKNMQFDFIPPAKSPTTAEKRFL